MFWQGGIGMKQEKCITFAMLHTLIPLCMGTGIYILVRPGTYIARICISLNPWLGELRIRMGTDLFHMFLRNYACDMLWAYALTIGLFWYGRLTGQKVWKSALISGGFAVLMESLQILPVIPGTFDGMDVVTEILAMLIAGCVSMIFYKYKDKERGEHV